MVKNKKTTPALGGLRNFEILIFFSSYLSVFPSNAILFFPNILERIIIIAIRIERDMRLNI